MNEKALEYANLLLREGALRKDDTQHQAIYAEIMGNADLFDEIHRRLNAVGYDLIEQFTHLGVRVSSDAGDLATLANNLGVHSGHIRLIVYFWVHLVYRRWVNLRRDLHSAPPGAAQNHLVLEPEDEEDDELWISYAQVERDFSEHLAITAFRGFLTQLKKWRFIGYHKKTDRIWADASLYVLIDLHRMEDFVTELARRLGIEDPAAAVEAIATGREKRPEEQT